MKNAAQATDDAAKASKEAADAFRTQLNEDTLAAFRESRGLGALNQIQSIFNTERDLEKKAYELGVAGGGSEKVDDQIGQLSHYKALTVLEGLSDEDFQKVKDHLGEFKGVLADWVTESEGMRKAIIDAAKAEDNYNRTLQEGARIKEYLKSLEVANDYTSPESRLNSATKQFYDAIGAAKGGDVDALSKVTGYADTLIKQLTAYYASGKQGQVLYQAIKDALASLPGVDAAATAQVAATTKDIQTAANRITDTFSQTIADLIASNDQAAKDAIARNISDRDALIAANDKAAANIIEANNAAAKALIASNDDGATNIIQANNASSKALIASNDNAADIAAAANSEAASRILAGASDDAKAIGASIFAVGDSLIRTQVVYADNDIGAIYGAGNAIVQATNIFADNQLKATYGAANSIIQAANYFADSQLTATYGTANSLITVGAIFADNQLRATGLSAGYIVDNIVTAIYNHSNANLAEATWQVTAAFNSATAIIGAIQALTRAVIDMHIDLAGQEVATNANLQDANFYLRKMAA
jgi:hypothetical protein